MGLPIFNGERPALPLDNFLGDRQTQPGPGNMLSPRGIDTKERFERTGQILLGNAGTVVVDDDKSDSLVRRYADNRTTAVCCGIDDEISQGSRKSQRGHFDRHLVETGDLNRQLYKYQLLTNVPDQGVEPDGFRPLSYGLFADKLNGAVGYPIQLIQVMEPLCPLFVFKKLRDPSRRIGRTTLYSKCYAPLLHRMG
ncbi:MAG: hypothetical protein JWP84_765 [Tardiphaga sp.]|nr:hypothetical protein [Tardiphaga sp.]